MDKKIRKKSNLERLKTLKIITVLQHDTTQKNFSTTPAKMSSEPKFDSCQAVKGDSTHPSKRFQNEWKLKCLSQRTMQSFHSKNQWSTMGSSNELFLFLLQTCSRELEFSLHPPNKECHQGPSGKPLLPCHLVVNKVVTLPLHLPEQCQKN